MELSELNRMLSGATQEVLESMFFTTLMGAPDDSADSGSQWISARLAFHGDPPGNFGVRMPLETGRQLAASFLGGESEVTESQTGEVICELANMVCGSMLSRLEKESRFELSSPEIEACEAACPQDVTASCAFGLEEGPVVVWLRWENTE